MNVLLRYFRFWVYLSRNALIQLTLDRFGFFIFLLGKLIRFSLYFAFLYFLVAGSSSLAGYNLHQVLFFFLTFNLIDILSQFFFRGVYTFRTLVVSGGFDLYLSKPVNPLFRSLLGGADFIDFVTIPPLLFGIYYLGSLLNPSFLQVVLYIILILNGLVISVAFHIFVLALGILTLEIDHTIMIYRDLLSLGRFPIDIYKEPLKSILTFIIPVGLMIALPVQALIGISPLNILIVAFIVSSLAIFSSIKFWNFALKKYSSASS